MTVMTSSGRRGAFLGLALLLAATSASAQMYKWVDANGKTHFTDQPPPANAKPAAIKPANGARAQVELPYALATAARSHPVTLYTTAPCAGCDLGRNFLKNRGVPFAEKTISNGQDEEALKQAGGDGSLPMLTIGRTKLSGFQAGSWTMALNAAQYPATKMLPPNYQFPSPQAAAPAQPKADPVKVAKSDDDEDEKPKAPAVPEARNAPPGFKF